MTYLSVLDTISLIFSLVHKQIGNISYELKGTVDIPLKSDKTASKILIILDTSSGSNNQILAAEIIVHRPVHELSLASAASTPERHTNQDIEGLSVNVIVNKNTFKIGETALLQFVSLTPVTCKKKF